MSRRYPSGFISAFYNPLEVPDAPSIVSATAGNAQGSIAFTAPADTGGGAITGYIVLVKDSSTGASFVNSGASSPIVVSGLTNDNTYVAYVAAVNEYGPSQYSAVSSSFTPLNQGQQAYTTAGSYTFVVPTGVTSISAVAIGGGAGADGGNSGGGGALQWINNISVTPGDSYTVYVGRSGYRAETGGLGDVSGLASYINDPSGNMIITAGGGVKGGANNGGVGSVGALYSGYTNGGGRGGHGGENGGRGGGGGGGGYSGAGGNGGDYGNSNGQNGSGGGGGGGGGANTTDGGQGGGTGILGEGANGVGGTAAAYGNPGTGGSGGTTGAQTYGSWTTTTGIYGGGSGAGSGGAGRGAVRIIWPGDTRYFPATNTGDV